MVITTLHPDHRGRVPAESKLGGPEYVTNTSVALRRLPPSCNLPSQRPNLRFVSVCVQYRPSLVFLSHRRCISLNFPDVAGRRQTPSCTAHSILFSFLSSNSHSSFLLISVYALLVISTQKKAPTPRRTDHLTTFET